VEEDREKGNEGDEKREGRCYSAAVLCTKTARVVHL